MTTTLPGTGFRTRALRSQSLPAVRPVAALALALALVLGCWDGDAAALSTSLKARTWNHTLDGGWQLDVLTADHLRLWKVDGGTLNGRVAAGDVQVLRPNGARINVAALGAHDYPVDKIEPPWPGLAVMRNELYLRLAEPLREGESVRIAARLPEGTRKFALVFTADRETTALKVNQIGYVPGDTGKTAYLGAFMGALGKLPCGPRWFEVVEVATGRVVWKGRSAAAPIVCSANGEEILKLPFGGLTRPGHYRIRVPGVGSSSPFLVDNDAYAVPFREGLRAFYAHRCGTAIDPDSTPHVHPVCHHGATEGVFHTSMTTTPLYGGETGTRDASGGWHDASDWGKYIPTAAAALYELLRVADLAPDMLLDDFSEIPESGNGVPDLLDEVAWEVDWFLKMQRSDGGVYHKLTGRAWNTDRPPQDDTQDRYFAEVTTHDTGRAAAVFALAARHLRPYDATRAQRYEQAALKAWQFLQAHTAEAPTGGFRNRDWNGGGEYGDRFGDVDERAWAAVELYHLTGQAQYHNAFLAAFPDTYNFYSPPVQVRDWPPLFEDSWRYALWTYSQLPDSLAKDAAIVTAIRRAWQERAALLVQRSAATPYGLSFTPPLDPNSGTYGFGDTNGIWYARDLLLAAFQVGPSDANVQAGLRNLDFFLGANGQGTAYMTGMGKRSVHNIEYKFDEHDGVEAPLPGHPVDGPSRNVFWANTDYRDYLFPADSAYPPMQRYYDFPDPVMNEPVVDEMGTTLIPLALMASPQARAYLLGQ